jgi:peptidoglycan/xylan/chitin deacetylase (PgdA/CDA1 family)
VNALTLFHAIAGNGTLTIDNVSVTGPGTSTPPDTTAPTVSITSPVEGTVSGIASIAATASDDTGVVGVQFRLDSINLDAEDATAPYSISWNTASTSNGSHILTAIARDAVGNSNTATRTVTVNNSTSTPNTFTEGMATLSFDDGWISQYIAALPILDSANIPATFNIITNETNGAGAGELISNGSLEVAGTNGDPAGWSRGGWGTNTSTYTYSNQGYTDNTAATVAITAYTSGDAKWYYEDVPVTPGQNYRYTSAYRSNIQSELVVRYTMNNSAVLYSFIATIPNSNNTWSILSHALTPPAGAVSATMFHIINGVGTLTLDTVSFGIENSYVTPLHVRTIEQAGNEISSHTKTHPSLPSLSSAGQTTEINGSKDDLLAMGVSSVQTIAYPYGEYSSTTQLITEQSGYQGARSVERGYNTPTTNAFGLKVQGVLRTTTLAEVINWIDTAEQNKTWLILMFHQIDNNPASTFGTTPALFEEIVSYLSTSGIRIVTTTEGLLEMQ